MEHVACAMLNDKDERAMRVNEKMKLPVAVAELWTPKEQDCQPILQTVCWWCSLG